MVRSSTCIQERGASTLPGSSSRAAEAIEEAEALTEEAAALPEGKTPGVANITFRCFPAVGSEPTALPATATLEASTSSSAALGRSPARDASCAAESRLLAAAAADLAADMSVNSAENWRQVRHGARRWDSAAEIIALASYTVRAEGGGGDSLSSLRMRTNLDPDPDPDPYLCENRWGRLNQTTLILVCM